MLLLAALLLANPEEPKWTAREVMDAHALARIAILDPAEFYRSNRSDVVLQATNLGRDGYYFQYAISARYEECQDQEDGTCKHRISFRMADFGARNVDNGFSGGLINELLAQEATKDRQAQRVAARSKSVRWMETDTLQCTGSFEALEAVRNSYHRPAPHFRLVDEGGDIFLHPSLYDVEMLGSYSSVSYRGPKYADGPAGKLEDLMDVLEACWQPSAATPPWKR